MKHLKLFEEYKEFDEHGTAGRDLREKLPEKGEKFMVPGFVNTILLSRHSENIKLQPGNTLSVVDIYTREKTVFRQKYDVEFIVNDNTEKEYTCDLDTFQNLLCYDIRKDSMFVISPEKMTKRLPDWRGRLAGKKYGF